MHTKIFLDSGDPAETKEIIELLAAHDRQLHGQTTNPTLVAKNPYAKGRFERGEKFSREELLEFYKKVIQDISALIPHGSVSIEVYADHSTTAEQMIAQAREMWKWIPNAHIKLPTNAAGLTAARALIDANMRVNMTLVFSQQQAAAVYAATTGAKPGAVFLSPFIGRLDDIGKNGMDLIANILKMYSAGDGHVQVLTASVRSIEHFQAAIALKSDIITSPHKVLKPWAAEIEQSIKPYAPSNLESIPYEDIPLGQAPESYNIQHELTHKGITAFTNDWNGLLAL